MNINEANHKIMIYLKKTKKKIGNALLKTDVPLM